MPPSWGRGPPSRHRRRAPGGVGSRFLPAQLQLHKQPGPRKKVGGGRRFERNFSTVRQREPSRADPGPRTTTPLQTLLSGARAGRAGAGRGPTCTAAQGSAQPGPAPAAASPAPAPAPGTRGRQVRRGSGSAARPPGTGFQGEGGGASEGNFPPKLNPGGVKDTGLWGLVFGRNCIPSRTAALTPPTKRENKSALQNRPEGSFLGS